ncbi:MAG: 4-hydroxy-tetrahydrodipicolinate synthase [Gammaproteobacteria bacterium]|nr:4-hydroxy-tetrahydrodipicolinate synthase [Gammaproteobacteria bacterium]
MKQQILWTAMVTPFNESGDSIDYDSFQVLLAAQAAAGNGILLCGSTAEALLLSNSERQQLVEFAIKLELEVPIMVGVPNNNLPTALEWLTFCHDLPIAAYLLTTPLYTKPGICGQTHWFQTLLDKINKPAMLYNIPSRTGIALAPTAIANIAAHDNLWAIKEATGSIDNIAAYHEAAAQMTIYCGDDYFLPNMAAKGAVGLVSVMANVWPQATHHYVEQCLAGENLDSDIWWQAGKAITEASNPIPVKALLAHLNKIPYPTVRPPLSCADLLSLESLSEADKAITTWEQPYV